ncbi:hypothetical protein GCM10023097_11290 [Streptomyces collinus]
MVQVLALPGAGGELGTVLVGEVAYAHPGAFGEVAGCVVRHPATVTAPAAPPQSGRPEPATGSRRRCTMPGRVTVKLWVTSGTRTGATRRRTRVRVPSGAMS